MRKIIITLLFCFIAHFGYSQFLPTPSPKYQHVGAQKVDTFIVIVPQDTADVPASKYPGAIMFMQQPGDTSHYYSNGYSWVKMGSKSFMALDSLRYDPATGIFYGRYTTGGELAVSTGLVDSLKRRVDSVWLSNDTLVIRRIGGNISIKITGLPQSNIKNLTDTFATKLTWDSPLTPMLTQPGIPIQPTTPLIKALPQLQQQINDFSGKFLEVNPALSQPGVNAKATGTVNVTTISGNGYGLNIERPDNISYDAALGYRVGGTVVGWAGLGNRNNNDYSIQFLTARTRLVNADTSGVQLIGVSQYGGLRMFAKFKNEKLLMGDSMQASAEAIAPIHVSNAADTGIYALHKIVSDVNLATSDSSHVIANTKYVKDQIAGYNAKYVQLSPAAAQSGAALNLTGNATLNRANTSTTAAYSILTGGVQTGYFGAASIGSNSLVVTASNGPLALYAPDSTSLNITSYGTVTPGNTFIKARSGKTVFGDSVASNVFGRYPIDVIGIQDTSIRAVNRIVQDYSLSLADNSKTVVTSSWIVSQAYLKAANATWQAATTAGNTTGNIIKITGSTGSLTGTNGGLEMFYDGTQAVLQGYDRVAATLKPIKLSATAVNIVAGLQLPVRTVTTTTTATISDYTILVNNSGAVTINLPAASSSTGTILVIKKLSAASNDVTIDPNASETIDTGTTKLLTLQFSSVMIQCDGTKWNILSSHAAATTL
ncbi:hypothetical protein AB6805_30665 [Chitinophaga sp. RCC_12]|uniref:hypothetical protein n=1 Tax=Chitinophaga sp. RCC_12 TaxID=3239226 RepID=UPI003523E02C